MNTVPLVPRIEDLPYISSPPIQFTYQSTAVLTGGNYIWADVPNQFSSPPTGLLVPTRPLIQNAVYYFRSITLSADIDELDYTSSIFKTATTPPVAQTPALQMYLKSNAQVAFFREPVLMVKYLQNFDYRLAWTTNMLKDQLYASFTGQLFQGVNLAGKTSITLTAVISAQEVADENYTSLFLKQFPRAGGING